MNNFKATFLEKIQILSNYIGDVTFNPVAPLDSINHFEKQFGVIIPDDYKNFVLYIANGFSFRNHTFLEKAEFSNYYHQADKRNPGLPFQYNLRTAWYDEEEDWNEYTKSYEYPYESKYLGYDYSSDNRHTLLNGAIRLESSNYLVVNGGEYGNVWYDWYESSFEVFPAYNNTQDLKRLTFQQWVLGELEIQIEIYASVERAEREASDEQNEYDHEKTLALEELDRGASIADQEFLLGIKAILLFLICVSICIISKSEPVIKLMIITFGIGALYLIIRLALIKTKRK